MAREYGYDRTVSVTVKLTEQEKEMLTMLAREKGMNISQMLRAAIALLSYKEDVKNGNCC